MQQDQSGNNNVSRFQRLKKGLSKVFNSKAAKVAGYVPRTLWHGFRGSVVGMAIKASILTSAFTYSAGEDIVSDSFEDYSKETGIDPALYEEFETDNLRVYKPHFLTPFHMPALQVANNTKSIMADEETPGYAKILTAAVSGTIIYFSALFNAVADAASQHPVNAYLISADEHGQMYIRPPANDLTASQMVTAFTGIPSQDLPDLSAYDEYVGLYIMLHELAHSGQSFDAPVVLNSHTLEGEVLSDIIAQEILAQHCPADEVAELGKIVKYARALSPFSRSGYDSGHVTALALDAYQKGTEIPSQQEIFYANQQLNEMVRLRLNDYDPVTTSTDRYLNVYWAMRDIVENSDSAVNAPLIKQTAELYMEAARYFAPTEVFLSEKPEIIKDTVTTKTDRQRERVGWQVARSQASPGL